MAGKIIGNGRTQEIPAFVMTAVGDEDWYEISSFNNVCVQLNGTWSGTVNFEQSNDGVTAFPVLLQNLTNTASIVSSATLVGAWSGNVLSRYFRCRFVPGTGSVTAIVELINTGGSALSAAGSITGNVTLLAAANNTAIGSLAASANNTGSSPSPGKITGAAASGFFKASAGRVFGWTLLNTNVAVRYLQIYAKASAGIPGTDTPAYTIPIGASGRTDFIGDIGNGQNAGVAWAITTDALGATIGAAGDIVGTVFWL